MMAQHEQNTEFMWKLYYPSTPSFINDLAGTPAMQRLKGVGMNCGCEYTSFPLFDGLRNYSRYSHSVGCALIVWRFTHDVRQTIAALLHDIATPTFAHVIDFLNNDHLKQESTEHGTTEIIASSAEIMEKLKELGLTLDDVADYHRYPIADNDSPKLSADRLEYTLTNMVNYRVAPYEDVQRWFEDLTVSANDEGEEELMFNNPEAAEQFSLAALRTSAIYIADEDRFAMQTLAELLKKHIKRGILDTSDLYQTEERVIALLGSDAAAAADWNRFRQLHRICRGCQHPEAKIIVAKKRHINPSVAGKGRVTECSAPFAEALQRFLDTPLDIPVWGE